jgi:hypothetical protein
MSESEVHEELREMREINFRRRKKQRNESREEEKSNKWFV